MIIRISLDGNVKYISYANRSIFVAWNYQNDSLFIGRFTYGSSCPDCDINYELCKIIIEDGSHLNVCTSYLSPTNASVLKSSISLFIISYLRYKLK